MGEYAEDRLARRHPEVFGARRGNLWPRPAAAPITITDGPDDEITIEVSEQ